MQKLVPHLWFDKEAKEASAFYTSLFKDSKIINTSVIKDTPSGDCDIVTFALAGQEFMAISAGPYFKFTPAISLMVNFDPSRDADARKEIDRVWEKLADGGQVLMDIGEYPFSKRYGWIQDKYGLSWQLILTDPTGDPRPTIVPSLLFVGDKYGKAGPALDFYLSVFKESPSNPSGQVEMGIKALYGKGQEPNTEGTVMFADCKLLDLWIAAMDGGGEHKFTFNEAFSLIVRCDTPDEIDYYWAKLSAVPEAEQCGWLKDKYGVSWQITPTRMDEMMATGTPEQIARVTQAFLKMKKFDIAALEKAFRG